MAKNKTSSNKGNWWDALEIDSFKTLAPLSIIRILKRSSFIFFSNNGLSLTIKGTWTTLFLKCINISSGVNGGKYNLDANSACLIKCLIKDEDKTGG